MPDQTTEQILAKNPGYFMSMAQGEWEEIIQQTGQVWEAIVTCFVLDTVSVVVLLLLPLIFFFLGFGFGL